MREYRSATLNGEEVWLLGDRLAKAPIDKVCWSINAGSIEYGGPFLTATVTRYKTMMEGVSAGMVERKVIWRLDAQLPLTPEGLEQFVQTAREAFAAHGAGSRDDG